MEKLLSSEVEEKLKRIVNIIENSEEYKEYSYLKEKMGKNEKIKSLISEIKTLQKQAVRIKALGQDDGNILEQLDVLEKNLLEIPLYSDFLSVQKKLNEIFLMIKEEIEKLFEL